MFQRRMLMLLAVPSAAVGIVIGGSVAANAATPPQLRVSLSSCGAGSSAVWNAAGNSVLTIGAAPAATCGAPAGSTYNPAYAQVVLSVKGNPVPTAEPVFTTDKYTSGSPRLVVDLNNGHSLIGYPAASGLNGTDMAWASDVAPNTYGAYSVAFTATNANTTTIKDAFIVQDADQTSGTSDTLTGIQFGGATADARLSNVVVVKNRATNKCLNEGAGVLSQYACDVAGTYASLRWQVATFADGSKYLESVGASGKFVKDGAQNQQLSLTSTPSPMTFANGGIFRFPNSLVMGVNNPKNFAPVIGSPSYSNLNNVRWDFANAPAA